jgi:MFS family permease
MGVYQSISSIGFLSGGLIGGVLLDSWGYSAANLLLAFGTFLVIPIAFTLTDKSSDITDQEQVQRFDVQTLFGGSALFKIGVGMMLTKLFLGSLISSTLAHYLVDIFGAEGVSLLGKEIGIASLTGFLLSFRIFSRFLFGPIIGVLSDKLGRQRSMFSLFLSGSFSLLILVFCHQLFWISLAVMLSFISDTGLGVVIASNVSDLVKSYDSNSQYTLSAFTNWIDIGSALGPLVIFSLINEISFNYIFVSASTILLLYAVLYIKKP